MKIVITSIQAPTPAVYAWAKLFPGNVIVVGDRKTPTDWRCEGVRYIPFVDYEPEVVDNYARKNIGYISAHRDDPSASIFETDDDTFPYPEFPQVFPSMVPGRLCCLAGWFNVLAHFTDEFVWPRGFPMSANIQPSVKYLALGASTCPVQSMIVDREPDVDAIFRLMHPDVEIMFDRRLKPIILEDETWCPFNTQATWWHHDFRALTYVPAFTQWRSNDIIKSFVAQRIVHNEGMGIAFHAPDVFQIRNPHDTLKDFKQETDLYLFADRMVHILERLSPRGTLGEQMMQCYEALIKNLPTGVIGTHELPRLERFLEAIK